jgi:formamidopyrimidine-DNA glycosylase
MPELPDVTVYVERLLAMAGGAELRAVRLKSAFLLRSVEPPLQAVFGRRLETVERLGKRIVMGFGDELFCVLHLMVAGRLRWKKAGAGIPGRVGLAAFDFDAGTVMLTEASKKKRASLYVVRGRAAVADHGRGGYEVLDGDLAGFEQALLRENRTLKRALTDPRLLSGIGNAYSDEILFCARLSPVRLTQRLTPEERVALHRATVRVLTEFTERLRAEVGDGFPDKVTAFRPDMRVHGRFGQPCEVCEAPIQRIRYADNETNYCASCQNAGRLLADRGLSRLMKKDWPRTLDELELQREVRRAPR